VSDSISKISATNLTRCLRWHPDGIKSWSLSDWAVAVSGEVGELCNVVKKLNRERDGLKGNKESMSELQTALWKEVADVYLYLDLFAQAAGMDLQTAIVQKFNEVSERNGFSERLTYEIPGQSVAELEWALREIIYRHENNDPMMPIECAQHCRTALGLALERDCKHSGGA
jgi:NTP pyrophosphatase (non-canonical NTP hydrolase)